MFEEERSFVAKSGLSTLAYLTWGFDIVYLKRLMPKGILQVALQK